MKSDSLNAYVTARAALLKEKAELEARLNKIAEALGDSSPSEVLVFPIEPVAAKTPAPRKTSKRKVENTMTLREAVLKVLAAGPMKKKDIWAGVSKLGYESASKNPLNSLSVFLYTCKEIKGSKGVFTLKK